MKWLHLSSEAEEAAAKKHRHLVAVGIHPFLVKNAKQQQSEGPL
jgi:hypothetical protein